MKTYTIITTFTASHGRPDGYITVTRYGKRISSTYFPNWKAQKELMDKTLVDLRVKGATHFKYVLN